MNHRSESQDMNVKDDLVMDAIRQFQRVAIKYARVEELPIQVEAELAITTREAHTIQAIGNQEDMSVTDVANAFDITKSAASQMVSKLADKGFLEKRQAPHSNKEYHLRLTPLGWKAHGAHENFHGKDKEELIMRLRVFSEPEITAVTALLKAVGDVLDKRLGN